MGKVVADEFRLPDDSLVFDQTNILGTVSQVAGVPTGRIIERGSNANGEYIRFADGTQMCWHSTGGTDINVAIGNVFRSAPLVWTYPLAFSVAPMVAGTPRTGTPVAWGWVGLGNASDTQTQECRYAALCALSNTGAFSVSLIAIGRWY